ncbi:LytR C-terminal domain-containing protein [Subtercola boreus]|uniref:LytR/CpsA/Psr regulator C-terminal domain-containing protein n=1 Tax=Subtercola boreus TaxID=120213 RepID=A0A3E0WA03_9MICO|nr:LytR C-terminal domain-containing protein [Subtercola boreus]RFA19313.1 hypothetical protein B7R24_11715 [Subtercola boreus]RFA19574.1 hypothetical protein B7R23_11695 [Subtercola boreus]RFA25939.1 hypothetical protein B7R25_11815 [Subtercola boreus]
MAPEPLDSFDNLPADSPRRGVHRGPRPRGRGWVAFGWAALATGVLVALGVLGLLVVNNGFQLTPGASSTTAATDALPSATATPTVEPTVDPQATVTILNGTNTEGLATRAGERATADGWSVGAEANASSTDVTVSTVYYSDAASEAAAKGLAASLGGIATALSDQFQGASLTAVLGTDYTDVAG